MAGTGNNYSRYDSFDYEDVDNNTGYGNQGNSDFGTQDRIQVTRSIGTVKSSGENRALSYQRYYDGFVANKHQDDTFDDIENATANHPMSDYYQAFQQRSYDGTYDQYEQYSSGGQYGGTEHAYNPYAGSQQQHQHQHQHQHQPQSQPQPPPQPQQNYNSYQYMGNLQPFYVGENKKPLCESYGFGDHITWTCFEKALAEAKFQNTPIMLIIHKSWCGACKALKPQFASSHEIKELSKRFVMVNVADDEEPRDQKFAPDGVYIPRILFMHPDGEVMTQYYNDAGNPNYKYFYSDSSSIARVMRRVINSFPKYVNEKYSEDL